MLVAHIILHTMVNRVNWLEVHLLRLPCGGSCCSLSFFFSEAHLPGCHFQGVLCALRWQSVPKENLLFLTIFFSPKVRELFELVSQFGVCISGRSFTSRPASTGTGSGFTLLRRDLFKCVYQMPNYILGSSTCVCHRFFSFNFSKLNPPPLRKSTQHSLIQ